MIQAVQGEWLDAKGWEIFPGKTMVFRRKSDGYAVLKDNVIDDEELSLKERYEIARHYHQGNLSNPTVHLLGKDLFKEFVDRVKRGSQCLDNLWKIAEDDEERKVILISDDGCIVFDFVDNSFMWESKSKRYGDYNYFYEIFYRLVNERNG